MTCDAHQYGQACYNYFSGIKNNKDYNNFACTDHHEDYRDVLTAVEKWKSEHNSGSGWNKYTTQEHIFEGKYEIGKDQAPICQVDEYPPAYFRDEKNKGQVVRYLPGSPNMSAGNLWRNWCGKNDGGEGNGQFTTGKKDLDTNLVKPVKKLKEHKVKGKGKADPETVYETWSVEYNRAIFSMVFDWKTSDLKEEPNEGNSWGLKLNPCWPEAIVPMDPGWVLDIHDDWYTKHGHVPNPDLRERYKPKDEPKQDLIDAAEAWLKAHPSVKVGPRESDRPGAPKRPHSNDGNGANKAPKPGTPPGSRRRRRSLDVSSNGLLGIRDHDFNLTRRLTDEELNRNIEVIQCADRTCSKERRALEENGEDPDASVLVINGEGPKMSPPENVEAVPTVTPILPRKEAAKLVGSVERRAASPDLPMVTTAPAVPY